MPRTAIMQRLSGTLTLLWMFVGVSALILAAGGFFLGSILTRSLRAQAVDDAKVSLAEYTDGVLSRYLVQEGSLVVRDELPEILERDLLARPDILNVKVWKSDGVLAWTSLAPERIGQRFPLDHELGEVIESGAAVAELETLEQGEEHAGETELGIDQALEVYAPVLADDGRVIGAYEIYVDSSRLEASIASRKHVIWLATGGVFAVLWALLALLVRRASGTLRHQTQALRERSAALGEAYRRLEESTLEAVESLNATVEAKDPYTVGHSFRVQRVALAVGQELGLAPEQLEALRLGAVFHDIGKIAVPDALLTKAEPLTPFELDLIRRHSVEGARILSKSGRLREVVPIVRHHHERWDGSGYPEGLEGDDIPVLAAITALADAWDTMTIERPYHGALTYEEALAEVQLGRGSRFGPAVVDAFFAAIRRNPGAFGVPEREALAAR